MIYTLTLAPAIDVYYKDDYFRQGEINRPSEFYYLPGGKGVNVTRVLMNLGRDSIALGVVGGASGLFLEQLLKEYKVDFDFVFTNKPTRINTKISSLKETALNAPQPKLNNKDYDALMNKLEKLKKDDYLIVSGAFPSNFPYKVFNKVLRKLKDKGVSFVFDVTREALIQFLPFNPLLIKPNKKELEDFFYHKMNSENEMANYAYKLLNMGAQNVLISLGKNGAILVTKEKTYHLLAPKGEVINTVGAGDSMVAGFVDTYLATHDVEKAFKRSVACGSATAFSSGLASKKEVNSLLRLIK